MLPIMAFGHHDQMASDWCIALIMHKDTGSLKGVPLCEKNDELIP